MLGSFSCTGSEISVDLALQKIHEHMNMDRVAEEAKGITGRTSAVNVQLDCSVHRSGSLPAAERDSIFLRLGDGCLEDRCHLLVTGMDGSAGLGNQTVSQLEIGLSSLVSFRAFSRDLLAGSFHQQLHHSLRCAGKTSNLRESKAKNHSRLQNALRVAIYQQIDPY